MSLREFHGVGKKALWVLAVLLVGVGIGAALIWNARTVLEQYGATLHQAWFSTYESEPAQTTEVVSRAVLVEKQARLNLQSQQAESLKQELASRYNEKLRLYKIMRSDGVPEQAPECVQLAQAAAQLKAQLDDVTAFGAKLGDARQQLSLAIGRFNDADALPVIDLDRALLAEVEVYAQADLLQYEEAVDLPTADQYKQPDELMGFKEESKPSVVVP